MEDIFAEDAQDDCCGACRSNAYDNANDSTFISIAPPEQTSIIMAPNQSLEMPVEGDLTRGRVGDFSLDVS